MPKDHIATGQWGERAAAAFLESLGCKILARNYRWSRAEIDIVAEKDRALHFVEVKTRRWDDVAAAREAVTRKKQRLIMSAAGRYMDDADYAGDFQFGIVVVIIDAGGNTQINWTPDAFGFYN